MKNSADKKSQIWGICSLFNTNETILSNYHQFVKSLHNQGLPLITVELAYNNDHFKLKKTDASILIQVRSNTKLWHKERLLNIGLENLPPDCKKVVFLDTDIIFENKDWVKQTSNLLNKFQVVQPFEEVINLEEHANNTQKVIKSGFITAYLQKNQEFGETGFAWAINRIILTKTKGLFDKAIFGSGDLIFAHAVIPQINASKKEQNILFSNHIIKDIESWQENIRVQINNNINFCNGRIIHLYHAQPEQKLYYARHIIAKLLRFNPTKDLFQNKDKCWELHNNTCKKNFLNLYFFLRSNQTGLNRIIQRILLAPLRITNNIVRKKIINMLEEEKTDYKSSKTKEIISIIKR